ncbi:MULTISPECIES: type III effector protein [Streptomyces]|uniref:type III effector protein n=1 Tax=Streptomyces TaxID=1883 RepID=UPI0018ACB0E4|nr:type III effector protein [Streptomyces sp. BRB081]MBL3803372.1 type III effector protein [Streptomyces sp. BRB081]WSU34760.1 type III effector protein [Streptomyces gougerotii]
MTTADRPGPAGRTSTPFTPGPASFLAVAGALEAIRDAVDAAESGTTGTSREGAGAEEVLASLLLLRRLREQLAVWEPGLVETAREAGASWAELARPLGVSSRQAAERRYLRNRPGAAGTTGEQRVQATRVRRAADRGRSAWARRHAADLRRLAAQVTSLTGLPPAARPPVARLDEALAHDDPAALLDPLRAAGPALRVAHPELAGRLDALPGPGDPAAGDRP